MPLVVLRRKPIVSDERIENVLHRLPDAVAHALSFGEPGADTQLTSDKIEIWVFEAHHLDKGTKDVEVIIFAHDYSERRENFEVRRKLIQTEIELGLCDKVVVTREIDLDPRSLTGWVWPFLGYSDFGRLFDRQR